MQVEVRAEVQAGGTISERIRNAAAAHLLGNDLHPEVVESANSEVGVRGDVPLQVAEEGSPAAAAIAERVDREGGARDLDVLVQRTVEDLHHHPGGAHLRRRTPRQ